MNRYKDTRKVSIFGIIGNIFLFIIKIIVATISKSQGMMADAVNSGTDIFTSIMTYIGNKLASKPNDREHPYGHGKIEYVFSLIISLSMIALSFKILQTATLSIIYKQSLVFSYNLVIVCITTIIVKFLLFIYTIKMKKKHDNLLIAAASEDHRNDIFVSLATLIGILCSKYGLNYIDGIVGIGISIWIIYVAIKLFISAYSVLIDTDINDNLKQMITTAITNRNDCAIDSLKSRPIGVNYILLIEVSIDDNISLERSHGIAEEIKTEVCKIEKIVDAIVHVNPKNNNTEENLK